MDYEKLGGFKELFTDNIRLRSIIYDHNVTRLLCCNLIRDRYIFEIFI